MEISKLDELYRDAPTSAPRDASKELEDARRRFESTGAQLVSDICGDPSERLRAIGEEIARACQPIYFGEQG